jgi:serine/threonine protein kinase
MTEFAVNGSLVSHLSSARSPRAPQLKGETRTERIFAVIVLAIRCVHSQGIIQGNLTPDNIRLDWDWNIRVGDFGHNIFINEPSIPTPSDRSIDQT